MHVNDNKPELKRYWFNFTIEQQSNIQSKRYNSMDEFHLALDTLTAVTRYIKEHMQIKHLAAFMQQQAHFAAKIETGPDENSGKYCDRNSLNRQGQGPRTFQRKDLDPRVEELIHTSAVHIVACIGQSSSCAEE